MQINIEKRHLIIFGLIIGGILILLSGIFVWAYGTSSPAVFGHSASEIGGLVVYSCHWEKSWKTYPVEGADLTTEKTSCNVGACQFKTDSTACNPSDTSCTDSAVTMSACGAITATNDEFLYCCLNS